MWRSILFLLISWLGSCLGFAVKKNNPFQSLLDRFPSTTSQSILEIFPTEVTSILKLQKPPTPEEEAANLLKQLNLTSNTEPRIFAIDYKAIPDIIGASIPVRYPPLPVPLPLPARNLVVLV